MRARKETERLRKREQRADKAAAAKLEAAARTSKLMALDVNFEVSKWRARAEEAEKYAQERKREEAVAAAIEDRKVSYCNLLHGARSTKR